MKQIIVYCLRRYQSHPSLRDNFLSADAGTVRYNREYVSIIEETKWVFLEEEAYAFLTIAGDNSGSRKAYAVPPSCKINAEKHIRVPTGEVLKLLPQNKIKLMN
jgi:hypothetical protein